VDTKQQTEAGVDRIRFQLNGLNQFTTPTIDDVYITNTSTRLGESRVVVLYPNADTADADWTRSTGVDHYATVDETTVNGDTDTSSASTTASGWATPGPSCACRRLG
jgi:hypothetical protein